MMTAKPVADRILANVAMDPNSGCWLWLGRLTDKGYGLLTSPQYPREQKAHRLSYLAFKGDIRGLCVCHSCDVRSCVNPDHLWLGTNAENIADAVAKGRMATGAGRHGNAKLTDDQVLLIRAQPFVSNRRLARHLGVSHTTIDNAIKGRTYNHLNRALKAGA